MLPTILIGPVALPTYPLFLLAAYWAGLWLAAGQAERLGLDGDHIYNAGLYGLLAGVVGARLGFVLVHWENYAPNLMQALSLSRSALSPSMGLITAGLVALIYLQHNQVPINDFLDAAAYGAALAIIIANVGAFLGGEALGAVTTVPWAVERAGIARHPVQLYESVTGLLILSILFLIRSRPWPGFTFWCFVILYSLSRLVLEIFRARPYIIGDGYLAVQLLALMTIVVGLVVMAHNFSKNPVTMSSEGL